MIDKLFFGFWIVMLFAAIVNLYVVKAKQLQIKNLKKQLEETNDSLGKTTDMLASTKEDITVARRLLEEDITVARRLLEYAYTKPLVLQGKKSTPDEQACYESFRSEAGAFVSKTHNLME